MKKSFLLALALSGVTAFAQNQTENRDFQHWHLLDAKADKSPGVSADLAMEKLKGRKTKTVIVAIIDSGVDTAHVDLKNNLWTNVNEIPGNGIDDDKNGYVDDIHGWNFLGGPDGNVEEETMELTRLYRTFKKQVTEGTLKKGDENWDLYQEVKKVYEEMRKAAFQEQEEVNQVFEMFTFYDNILKNHLNKENYTVEDLSGIETTDQNVKEAASVMRQIFENGLDKEALDSYKKHADDKMKYALNTEFNPRNIIGDNPADFNDSIYGNNDVMGLEADHGCHVAGIVGAVRGNGVGMDGIAPDVKIMAIRAVPNGDERDKDVALAIRYAVKNGADVINMSFGKGYSIYSKEVAEAIKFAEQHQVLMIHAAGNDAVDIDKENHFPKREFENTNAENPYWIEVGANDNDRKKGLLANFSNYGKNTVDIFAPGVDIYSTIPGSKYAEFSGTSMAAPVVTGVVALILNYFPDTDRSKLKQLLVETGDDYGKKKVYFYANGEEEKVRFNTLSNSGKVINAENAVDALLKAE